MIEKLQAENARLAAASNAGKPRVNAVMEGNVMVLRVPLHSPKLSSTGNSQLVGQASGLTGVKVDGLGEVRVTVSCYVPLPKGERVAVAPKAEAAAVDLTAGATVASGGLLNLRAA